MNYVESSTSVQQELPADIIIQVLSYADAKELALCSCTCRMWQNLAVDFWKAKAQARWKIWEERRWETKINANQWQQIYSGRHLMDKQIFRCLSALSWPLKREECLQKLCRWSLDAFDCLQAAISATGPAVLGLRYWARWSLTKVQVHRACSLLKKLMKASADTRCLEEGVLCISQVHHPTTTVAKVSSYLNDLATALRSRCLQQQASEPEQILQELSQMLFGAPLDVRFFLRDGRSADALSCCPPAGYGLGLEGNQDDYSNPKNSLLYDVLISGVGSPISLSVVHMLLAQRVGLHIDILDLSGRLINCLVIPATEDKPAKELYIDICRGGMLMTWDQVRNDVAALGIAAQHSRLTPMSYSSILSRMVGNLVTIYSNRQDRDSLKNMLDLATAIDPKSQQFWIMRSRTAIVLKDFSDARLCIHKLKEVTVACEMDRYKQRFLETQLEQMLKRVEESTNSHQASCVTQKMRSSSLAYAVGDVVVHKRFGYRGVIYDWDNDCSLNPALIGQTGVDSIPGGRHQPFYRVLVDTRDRPLQITYVAQCHLDLSKDKEHGSRAGAVQHPIVGAYFEGLDVCAKGGPRYVPNSYMRYRFPGDCQLEEPLPKAVLSRRGSTTRITTIKPLSATCKGQVEKSSADTGSPVHRRLNIQAWSYI